jgi:hypothetical protein
MGQQPSFTRSVLCNAATLDSAHAALVVLAASEAEAAGWDGGEPLRRRCAPFIGSGMSSRVLDAYQRGRLPRFG